MGQYALIVVTGFLVLVGAISIGMRSDTRIADMESARIQIKEEAREASLAGLQLAMRNVVLDEGPWSGAAKYSIAETEYERSTFITTVTPVGTDTLDIMSVGTKNYIDRSGAFVDTTHTVDVRLIRELMGTGPPPALKRALVVDRDLDFKGVVRVSSLDETLNADVHTNGVMSGNGNFLVEGFGTYTTGDEVKKIDNFQPNVDLNGLVEDNVIFKDSIPVPPIDFEALRTLALAGQGVHIGGDITVDGDVVPYSGFAEWAEGIGAPEGTGATMEKPFVFFTDGSLNFGSGLELTLDGFGIWVTPYDMHIASNSAIHGTISIDEDGLPTSQMAIFIGGDAIINGTADITASLVIEGSWRGNGTATVVGGAVVDDMSRLNGTFDLTWAGPNQGIWQFLGGPVEIYGPHIAAWAEW